MATVPIVTDVTYDELVALIQASELQQGLQYSLTFQTKHYILDYLGIVVLDPSDGVTPIINTGDVEHLVLTANSTNSFDKNVRSLEFPQDDIYYDWNPDNWLLDIAFCIDGTTIVDGFKGIIFKRNDTVLSNSMGYDFRNVKLRRWKRNDPTWDSGTTYNKAALVKSVSGSGVYMSLVSNNLNNATTDISKWALLIDYAVSEYYCCDSAAAEDISDFVDVKTFAEGTGYATYQNCVKNNCFEQVRDDKVAFVGYTASIISNNVFYLANYANYSVYGNNYGAFFECNTIGSTFYANSFRYLCYNNIFTYTNYENIIGNEFKNNICNGLFFNSILGGCGSNKICGNFSSNTLDIDFSSNNVAGVFRLNKGACSSSDFINSAHVAGNYNCEIVKTSTGTFKLKYIDGSDNTEKIVDVTT